MTLEEIVSLCKCPICGADFALNHENDALDCSNKHSFPVYKSRIPILLPQGEKSKDGSEAFINRKTSRSFTRQWELYRAGDRVWGMTAAELKDRILDKSDLDEADIAGKRILDLGCGHGLISTLFGELGADVLGFDISQGFFERDAELDEQLKERVHFVQGDIFHFPLKDGVFDFICSEGVLHHTPDTREAFEKIRAAVKKGGRIYLTLYTKGAPYTRAHDSLRKITTKLPGWLLVFLCYLAAPFFALLKYVLNLTKRGARTYERRTLRENAVSLHDSFSPQFVWRHRPEEVVQWFRDAEFENVKSSAIAPHIFAVYGDRT